MSALARPRQALSCSHLAASEPHSTDTIFQSSSAVYVVCTCVFGESVVTCAEGCHDDVCVYNNSKWSIVLLRVLLSMVERSASVSICGKRVELNRLSDHVHCGIGKCLDSCNSSTCFTVARFLQVTVRARSGGGGGNR